MTKEEILINKMPFNEAGETIADANWNVLVKYDTAIEAMDEYAKQVAIDFGEWLSDHPLILEPSSGTGYWIGLDCKIQTTADLFTQFLKQYNQ